MKLIKMKKSEDTKNYIWVILREFYVDDEDGIQYHYIFPTLQSKIFEDY